MATQGFHFLGLTVLADIYLMSAFGRCEPVPMGGEG